MNQQPSLESLFRENRDFFELLSNKKDTADVRRILARSRGIIISIFDFRHHHKDLRPPASSYGSSTSGHEEGLLSP